MRRAVTFVFFALCILLGAVVAAFAVSGPCPTNYTKLTGTGPAPIDFRPYAMNSPWSLPLPTNPTPDPSSTWQNNIKAYAQNSRIYIRSMHDDAFNPSVCQINQPGGRCGGVQSFGFWVAKLTDPQVTYVCNNTYTNYGCTLHDAQSNSGAANFSYVGHAPVNFQASCNDSNSCGDSNWAIIQPDGNILEAYQCPILQDVANSNILGAGAGSICSTFQTQSYIGSAGLQHVTDKGESNLAASGPPGPIYFTYYNEAYPPATARIRHAIMFNVGCVWPGTFRYPATSETRACNTAGQGVPAGTRFYLNRTVAQIDADIAAGNLRSFLRPFYIALREYGGYILDTGTGTPAFEILWLEDPSQWIRNGHHNPWTEWFANAQANGGNVSSGFAGFGSLHWVLQEQSSNFFGHPNIVNNLIVLPECYARGNCGDSPAAETCDDTPPVIDPDPTLDCGPVN